MLYILNYIWNYVHASYNFKQSLLDHRVAMLILLWNTVASDIVLWKLNYLNILQFFPSPNFTYTIQVHE